MFTTSRLARFALSIKRLFENCGKIFCISLSIFVSRNNLENENSFFHKVKTTSLYFNWIFFKVEIVESV